MAEWKFHIKFATDWPDKTPAEHAMMIYYALDRDSALVDYTLESDQEAMDKFRGIMFEFDRRSVWPNRTELMSMDEDEFDDLLDELYDWGDRYRIAIG